MEGLETTTAPVEWGCRLRRVGLASLCKSLEVYGFGRITQILANGNERMARKAKIGMMSQMMSVTLGRIEIALQRETPSLSEVLAAASSYVAATSENDFLPSDMPIGRIGLLDKTAGVLKANGIANLGGLLASTPGDLFRLEGFTPSLLEDIRQTLGDKNLHLRGDKDLCSGNVLRKIQYAKA